MEAKKLSISLKTIYIVLGIIAIAIIGYVAVVKMFRQNVAGKTYISVPTVKNQKIESMVFTEKGTVFGEEFDTEMGKWKSLPFSGEFEFQDDKLYISSASGLANMSAIFKWTGKDKFIVIDSNSDTTTYVLKGSAEDVSLLDASYLMGKTYFTLCKSDASYPLYESLNFTDSKIIKSAYGKTEKFWYVSDEYNDPVMTRDKVIVQVSEWQSLDLFSIKWLSREKFLAKSPGSDDVLYILKGSKEDPTLKK